MNASKKIWIATILVATCYIHADEIVLQNGTNNYSGCKDSYLVMNTDKAQGAKELLVLEGYHCSACIDQRVLLQFDLSSISSTAEITNATLSLFCQDQPRPGSASVNVHTITRTWDESTSTWMKATSTENWTTTGGDFTKTPSVTYTYGTDVNSWHTVNVTADIKSMLSGQKANNGFLLFMQPAMLTARYISSNSSDVAHRPKLTIQTNTAGVKLFSDKRTKSNISYFVNSNKLTVLSPVDNFSTISIFSVNGKPLFSRILNSNQCTMDISDFSSGTYIIRIKNSSATQSDIFTIRQ